MVAPPPPPLRVETLARLKARIEALERRHAPSAVTRVALVATGWPSVDAALGGGLPRGAVVEWIGVADPAPDTALEPDALCTPSADAPTAEARAPDTTAPAGSGPAGLGPAGSGVAGSGVAGPAVVGPGLAGGPRSPRARAGPGAIAGWAPPLSILLHLAHRALDDASGADVLDDRSAPDGEGLRLGASPAAPRAATRDATGGRRRAPSAHDARPVLWVGRRVWPYPRGLVRTTAGARSRWLLERSLFVDADDDGARLWAIDLALRCRALAAVVADAHGLPMAASRRLQLAAEAGDALALLARPPDELHAPSAAAVRWLVAREPGEVRPAWRVTLRRAKGASSAAAREAARPFLLEGDPVHGVLEGVLPLPADPLDRPRPPAPAPRGRERRRLDDDVARPGRPTAAAGVPVFVRRAAKERGLPRTPDPAP